MTKESYEILEQLVTISGKLNTWTGSKGVQVPFNPPKILARNQILLEISPEDITSTKTFPHKFIPSLSAKDLILKSIQRVKQAIEAEICPYLQRVYGDNRYPNLKSFFCTLPGELQRQCILKEGVLQTKILQRSPDVKTPNYLSPKRK